MKKHIRYIIAEHGDKGIAQKKLDLVGLVDGVYADAIFDNEFEAINYCINSKKHAIYKKVEGQLI